MVPYERQAQRIERRVEERHDEYEQITRRLEEDRAYRQLSSQLLRLAAEEHGLTYDGSNSGFMGEVGSLVDVMTDDTQTDPDDVPVESLVLSSLFEQVNEAHTGVQEAKRDHKIWLHKTPSPQGCRMRDEQKYYELLQDKTRLEMEFFDCLNNKASSLKLRKTVGTEYEVYSVDRLGQFLALCLRPVGENKENLHELHISLMKLCNIKKPFKNVLSYEQQTQLARIAQRVVYEHINQERKTLSFSGVSAQVPTQDGIVVQPLELR